MSILNDDKAFNEFLNEKWKHVVYIIKVIFFFFFHNVYIEYVLKDMKLSSNVSLTCKLLIFFIIVSYIEDFIS